MDLNTGMRTPSRLQTLGDVGVKAPALDDTLVYNGVGGWTNRNSLASRSGSMSFFLPSTGNVVPGLAQQVLFEAVLIPLGAAL